MKMIASLSRKAGHQYHLRKLLFAHPLPETQQKKRFSGRRKRSVLYLHHHSCIYVGAFAN